MKKKLKIFINNVIGKERKYGKVFKRFIFLKSVSDGHLGRPCSDFFKICSSHPKIELSAMLVIEKNYDVSGTKYIPLNSSVYSIIESQF